jgi:hypothetical protein
MSVQSSKPISERILETALLAGCGAIAAWILSNPIGVAGGALYGGVAHVSSEITTRLMQQQASTTAGKVALAALAFVASTASAWAVVNAAGFHLSLLSALPLTLLTISIPLAIPLVPILAVIAYLRFCPQDSPVGEL